jgi:transposase
MIGLPSSVKIYLFSEPVDMRNGHDGLAGIVTRNGQDVFNGHLFVFYSKRRDRIKILTWDRGGYILWYKRLELGRFKLSRISKEQKTISLDAAELSMLLDGIDFSRVRRSQKWQPPQKNATVLEPVADHV